MTSNTLPSLKAICAFEATARRGTASAAAEELNVTHGAISRQLRLLEEELGGELFVRQGRRLVLNEAGRAFADQVTQALDQLRSARHDFQQRQKETPLVINCPGSLLARWFIPRLERLKSELSHLHLRLVTGDEDSLAEGVDANIGFMHSVSSGTYKVQPLKKEQIGPVLAPSFAEKIGLPIDEPLPPTRLYDHPLLHTISRPQAWPTWFRSHEIPLERLQQGQSFEHLYYLLEAAEAGLGIAIAPQMLVEDALTRGRLIAPWGFTPTEACLTLIYRKTADKRLTQQLADLANWIVME
ncbi:HTH-type transcriptional regulator TrpI [Halomonadaceae bacterium LMG 33818]|uniref:LysR family transcriptional regulator n=1 Tax=Cernens ardua TaxID=3402176 RepID=UPI003EDC4488